MNAKLRIDPFCVGEVRFKNQRANYPDIRIDSKKGLKFEGGTDYNMRDIV